MPAIGDVQGYFYFRPWGTRFYPDWHYLGSRNWHKGDGTPWPEFGEKETTKQTWRDGSLAVNPPDVRLIGSAECIRGDSPDALELLTVRGIDARCWAGPITATLAAAGGVEGGGAAATAIVSTLAASGGVEGGGAAAILWWEDDVLPGTIIAFGADTVPSGYLACDGAAVSRTTYANLFTAIGVTWGVGNGTTTFNVPDLLGRVILGSGSGSGLTARNVADTGGVEQHQLNIAELPAHDHALDLVPGIVAGGAPGIIATPGAGLVLTSQTGNDAAHENMQPWACVKWLIKT